MVSLQSKRLLLVVFLLALFVAPSHSFKFPSFQQVEDALNKAKDSVSSVVSSVVSEIEHFFSKEQWDAYFNKVEEIEIFDEEKWTEFFSKVKDIRFSSLEEKEKIIHDCVSTFNTQLQHLQTRYGNVSISSIHELAFLNNFLHNSKEHLNELRQTVMPEVVHWVQEHPDKVLIAVIIVGAVVTPVFIDVGIGALGFTALGIEEGSWAAYIMSLYGGEVTVGSLCAILQSVGAVGLSFGENLTLSLLGGIIDGTTSYIVLEKLGAAI